MVILQMIQALIRWIVGIVGILALPWLDYKSFMESLVHLHYLCPPRWLSKLDKPGILVEAVPIDNHYVISASGSVLGVWSVERPASLITIVYLHGQISNRGMDRRRRVLEFLHAHVNMNVVTYDPSGYGDSTGWPTSENLKKDVASVIAWAKERFTDSRIVVWGHSLGGPIAAHAATLGIVDGLVLESTFAQLCHPAVHGVFGAPLWLLPVAMREWLVKTVLEATIGDHLDTIKYVKSVTVPILLIHGAWDLIVPIANQRHIASASTSRLTQLTIPLAGHNNLYVYDYGDGFPDLVKTPLCEWLSKI